EIDEQQRKADVGIIADAGVDGGGQPLAVVQPGQRIVGRLMFQLGDVAPAFGDIPLYSPDAAEMAVLDGAEEGAAQPDELAAAIAVRRLGFGDVVAEADEAAGDPAE